MQHFRDGLKFRAGIQGASANHDQRALGVRQDFDRGGDRGGVGAGCGVDNGRCQCDLGRLPPGVDGALQGCGSGAAGRGDGDGLSNQGGGFLR